jgi:hypothetical protein
MFIKLLINFLKLFIKYIFNNLIILFININNIKIKGILKLVTKIYKITKNKKYISII